jgi:glycosyltransferase involved in cell wall biosynthesis
MPHNIDLILPCFNPPADFAGIVNFYFRNLKALFPDRQINLYIVNDGSTINFTNIQIQQLLTIQESVNIVSYLNNRGKGYALRKAISETHSPLIVYTDYDFPFHTGSIKLLIDELDKGADIVLASRNSEYLYLLPLVRRFYSLMSKILNRLFLRVEFYDTQGGLKGFNGKGKEIFMKTRINEFLFDTEFIYLASKQKDISIVNIHGIIREGLKPSKIRIGVITRELVNYFKILSIKNIE